MDVDDTLVLILERIDSPVSLIRAASTCRRWCRVIADAGFLRRYRSLHGPPVAGDYRIPDAWTRRRYGPSFVPSSSIDARHFSLDFIINQPCIFPYRYRDRYQSWRVLDSRGSLLLMECIHETYIPHVFPDIVVCEPLTRRYKIILQPPDFDGANCMLEGIFLVVCEPLTRRYKIILQPPDFDGANCMLEGIFLVDGEEDEAGGRIGMSNFRVLCLLLSRQDPVAHTTMFNTDQATWSEKAIDHVASSLHPMSRVIPCSLRSTLGSSYFYVEKEGTLMTRDHSTGKFTSSVLSPAIKSYWDRHMTTENSSVVDGGDGEPRIVTVIDHTMEVFARVDGRWGLEKKVMLSEVTRGLPGYQPSFFKKSSFVVKRGVGFIVISPWEAEHPWLLSIDLKTMEVAPTTDGDMNDMAHPCEFPWPPVLQACLD